jgi:hypothetical protein
MLKDFQITAYLPAKDLARAKKFYEEKIGLTPSASGGHGAMYPCGKGSRVYLYSSPGAGTNQAGSKTKDGIAIQGSNKAAWFKDTEGNILALIQPMG